MITHQVGKLDAMSAGVLDGEGRGEKYKKNKLKMHSWRAKKEK